MDFFEEVVSPAEPYVNFDWNLYEYIMDSHATATQKNFYSYRIKPCCLGDCKHLHTFDVIANNLQLMPSIQYLLHSLIVPKLDCKRRQFKQSLSSLLFCQYIQRSN